MSFHTTAPLASSRNSCWKPFELSRSGYEASQNTNWPLCVEVLAARMPSRNSPILSYSPGFSFAQLAQNLLGFVKVEEFVFFVLEQTQLAAGCESTLSESPRRDAGWRKARGAAFP